MRSIIHFSLIALTIVVTMLPETASAQEQPERQVLPVTLIELKALPPGKRAVVIRRASGPDKDIIALTNTSTGQDLTAAIQLLNAMYARFGEVPSRDMMVAVDGGRRASTARQEAEGLDQKLQEQLRRSETRRVNGFGNVRAVGIHVPKRIPRLRSTS